MPHMKGLRGELTRAVRKELAELAAINLHRESTLNGVPVPWLLDNLDGEPATVLDPENPKLGDLGVMCYVLNSAFIRSEYISIGVAHYFTRLNARTKKHRFLTTKEFLHGQTSPRVEPVKLAPFKAKNLGTRRLKIIEVPQEGEAPEAPELSATREELNPLINNAIYMRWQDLQAFRAALERWLRQIAPRLYNCKDIN
jgi:hypothetical protein